MELLASTSLSVPVCESFTVGELLYGYTARVYNSVRNIADVYRAISIYQQSAPISQRIANDHNLTLNRVDTITELFCLYPVACPRWLNLRILVCQPMIS